MKLATCSYSMWRPEMGVPVQTSIGSPKFWTGPTLHDGRSMAPWGLLGIENPEEFSRKYRHRLHRRSTFILATLEDIAACYPETTGVLLCFERRREDCHRSVLAEWLTEWSGFEVPEWG